MSTRSTTFLALSAAAVMASAAAAGGGPGGLAITWWTIDTGGGTSTAGSLSLSGTIGQYDAAPRMNNGSLRLYPGFWAGMVPTRCGPADLGSTGGIPPGDGLLDNNDFVVFINYFFSHDPNADVGSTGGLPPGDGLFDNNDFVVFIDLFFGGCP